MMTMGIICLIRLLLLTFQATRETLYFCLEASTEADLRLTIFMTSCGKDT